MLLENTLLYSLFSILFVNFDILLDGAIELIIFKALRKLLNICQVKLKCKQCYSESLNYLDLPILLPYKFLEHLTAYLILAGKYP
jgi:hypothetical protein